MARATNADYEQWTADGKPLCLKCGKRHPPPCSAPSRRKRQAEEPAEGSTARASRRRGAAPRAAPVQVAPATTAPSLAPLIPATSIDTRSFIERMNDSEEAREYGYAAFDRALAGTSATQERCDLLFSLFRPTGVQAVAPQMHAATIAAPAAAQPRAHEDWSTHGGWPTQSDWQSQNIWSTYGDEPTQSTWSTHGDDWSTQDDWSNQVGWSAQDDGPNLAAQSTNSRPRGHAGRRQPRANRATRNRRN